MSDVPANRDLSHGLLMGERARRQVGLEMTKHTMSWALCFLVFGAACGGSALDGGSAADAGSPGNDAGSAEPDRDASPGAPTMLGGTVHGRAFVSMAVDVRREGTDWFFTAHNYATTCGASSGPMLGPDLALVTVGKIAAKAGVESIAYGDDHGATFQTGLYEQGKGEPVTTPASAGTLRFDTWSDEPGTKLTGTLKLVGEGSDVAGAFTATVCPPRG